MNTIPVPSCLSRFSTSIRSRDLLGGEHGGGLVQDEDASLAVQGAEDLDALLRADRDVLDRGVGVDGQPVAVRQLA